MNIPGVIRIKATVSNRRYWVLSLDAHSVRVCVCMCVILSVCTQVQMTARENGPFRCGGWAT